MRKISLVILILVLLTSTHLVFAEYTQTFASGKEWTEKMSPVEKLISILKPYITLQKYGVPVRHTPQDYIEKIDRVLLYNPNLGNEDVSNIFSSTMYAYEPQTRPALDALELEFLKMKVKDSDVLKPYLILRKSDA